MKRPGRAGCAHTAHTLRTHAHTHVTATFPISATDRAHPSPPRVLSQALLTEQPRMATITASVASQCLVFEKDAFVNMFGKNPEARADFELRVLRGNVDLIHVLRHKAGLEYFTRHMENEYSKENIMFWRECALFSIFFVANWAADTEMVRERAKKIYDKHVSNESPAQVRNCVSSCASCVCRASCVLCLVSCDVCVNQAMKKK